MNLEHFQEAKML